MAWVPGTLSFTSQLVFLVLRPLFSLFWGREIYSHGIQEDRKELTITYMYKLDMFRLYENILTSNIISLLRTQIYMVQSIGMTRKFYLWLVCVGENWRPQRKNPP